MLNNLFKKIWSLFFLVISLYISGDASAKTLFISKIKDTTFEFRLYEPEAGINDVDLKENGRIFTDAVTTLYFKRLELSLKDLNKKWNTNEDYQQWINANIKEEEEICKTAKALCIQVLKDGNAVAWASFEEDLSSGIQNAVYIRQMMVLSEYQRFGIGKVLLNNVLPLLRPESKDVFIITRIVNTPAINFYKKHGFIESAYMHEGYDPNVYRGFERHNK